jgi:GT2 family glycosyltransferase
MKSTAIVILNWNGQKLLEHFLPALLRHTPAEEVDIIVADNGSSDTSIAFLQTHYPTVLIQPFDRNYGFAEGYNRALQDLDYEWVVLLNSDVEVSPEWFTHAMTYLHAHPEITALQPKIRSYRDPSRFEYAGACGGFLDKWGYPWCRGRILQTVEEDRGQYDTPLEVHWTSGACMFIRLADYRAAGGLDAAFFAHQEEIDLCWRLRLLGKKLVCLPASVVYHVGAATLQKESPKKTFLNFRNNLWMLRKNLPAKQLRRVLFLRWFLDHLAALQMLFTGQFKNAWAVGQARRAVRRTPIERTPQQLASASLYPKSILIEYYLKGKKTYRVLHH